MDAASAPTLTDPGRSLSLSKGETLHRMKLSGVFGPATSWPDQDLVALSEEFDPDLVVAAYAAGVFPMPLREAGWPPGTMGWWSPVRRGVLPLEFLRVPRSLRQSAKRFVTSVDTAFDEVVARCADPARPGGWIDHAIIEVYGELHRRGVAHSVEVWTPAGQLVGGLYGVGIAGLFAGESMFHDPVAGRDASKVALVRLVELLDDGYERLLDVQWLTEHLASLGAIEVDRSEYLALLADALDLPAPDFDRAISAPVRNSRGRNPRSPHPATGREGAGDLVEEPLGGHAQPDHGDRQRDGADALDGEVV